MERTERIALLHGLLTRNRHGLSNHRLMQEAECSRSTLELTLPYANPRELLMDVQRYGADAEIIAPTELREQMRGMLVAALGRYAAG